jgi:hypothetical protein
MEKEELLQKLTKVNADRVKFYDEKLKELKLTEEQFALNVELQKQLTNEFDNQIKKVSKLKKFWDIINGNKTIIGSVTLLILQAIPIPEPYKSISLGVVSLLTGAAFTSHVKKGYFREDKGQ